MLAAIRKTDEFLTSDVWSIPGNKAFFSWAQTKPPLRLFAVCSWNLKTGGQLYYSNWVWCFCADWSVICKAEYPASAFSSSDSPGFTLVRSRCFPKIWCYLCCPGIASTGVLITWRTVIFGKTPSVCWITLAEDERCFYWHWGSKAAFSWLKRTGKNSALPR